MYDEDGYLSGRAIAVQVCLVLIFIIGFACLLRIIIPDSVSKAPESFRTHCISRGGTYYASQVSGHAYCAFRPLHGAPGN